ncbi:MAG: hypothetical protein AB1796_02265 [Bacillota bacterium]
MRITALHNIREPGLIPNGFQREEAPPPAPDPAMQPEMRNRVEAQTDTRHAVEFLNPRTRLETNGVNRTNNTYPGNIEMGRERERMQPDTREMQGKTTELNDTYERLLRILLGQDRSGHLAATQTDPASRQQAPVRDTEPAQQNRPIVVYVEDKTRDHDREGSKSSYYQRRGVEAYRMTQALYQESSMVLKA